MKRVRVLRGREGGGGSGRERWAGVCVQRARGRRATSTACGTSAACRRRRPPPSPTCGPRTRACRPSQVPPAAGPGGGKLRADDKQTSAYWRAFISDSLLEHNELWSRCLGPVVQLAKRPIIYQTNLNVDVRDDQFDKYTTLDLTFTQNMSW